LKNEGEGLITGFIKCRGHSSPLVKVKFANGETSFLIAGEGLKIGDKFYVSRGKTKHKSHVLPLADIPVGTSVFNIEGKYGDGGKYVRSGGCFAKISAKNKDKVTITLPSKKQKIFSNACRASIGVVAGSGRKEKPFMKAGRKFHYMKARNKLYPRVSGVAMNAVDHPFGTSRSSKKGRPDIARKNAPPGAKVGKVRPRRTGKKN